MNANIEVNHEDKIIVVCMDCYPGNTALTLVPGLAAVSYYGLSHGLCQPCKAKRMLEIYRAKRALAAQEQVVA